MPGIGSSYFSMFKQMIAGLEAVKTKYVAFAEHDCLYTPEHFKLRPVVEDQVNYNINRWHANWDTGEYTYYRIKVFSQLISNTKTALTALKERLDMALDGLPPYVLSEPGLKDYYEEFKLVKKLWCKKNNRPHFRYRATSLKTKSPNIDIRHSTNITNAKWIKGRKSVRELPHWGNFKEYTNESRLH